MMIMKFNKESNDFIFGIEWISLENEFAGQ